MTPGDPPPGYPPPGQVPPGGYHVGPPGPVRPTNTNAIMALVFGFVFAPLGIVFGHLARRQIAETGEEGDTLATVGIIVGWVHTGLWICGCLGFIVYIGALSTIIANSGAH